MRAGRTWLILGSLLAGLSVVNGAMAAHMLDGYFAEKYASGEPKKVAGVDVPLAAKRLQDFRTGAEYQMYHSLGMIAVGTLCERRSRKSLQVAGWSFLLGIVLFSGSLYVLTLTGTTWWGMVTPFGGVLFIIGWIALALGVSGRSAMETEGRS